MRGKAYAAGTVINALATGVGCAFGLNLTTEVKIIVEEDLKHSILIDNGIEREDKIVNRVVNRVLLPLGLKGIVDVKSEIPQGAGLGSSSAFMNALLISAFKLKENERELDAIQILKTNAKISLEMGISYTGALDDAAASLLGGIVITNNLKMEIIKRETFPENIHALILLPRWDRGEISLDTLQKNTSEVELAVDEALNSNFRRAMQLNSRYYCLKLGYPYQPISDVESLFNEYDSIHAGLSGNGPTYVSFGEEECIREVEKLWKEYGTTIRTRIVSTPSDSLVNFRK